MAWYYQRVSVIAGLVLFGPAAFPLLWKSPLFTHRAKVWLTVIFTLLTIVMVYMTWESLKLMVSLIVELMTPVSVQ